jgi:hypothetical protein
MGQSFLDPDNNVSAPPATTGSLVTKIDVPCRWLALEIMAQTVPDTSVSAGTYDKANPSFHTNVVCALFGATAFVVVMVTEIEVVRDFKAPSARWFSRKLAFSILGLVVSLNCLRIFFAEALLFTQVEKLGLACNAIDAVTILILLLFGITAFVFLVRARAAVSFRVRLNTSHAKSRTNNALLDFQIHGSHLYHHVVSSHVPIYLHHSILSQPVFC